MESELKQPCFSKEGDLWHLGICVHVIDDAEEKVLASVNGKTRNGARWLNSRRKMEMKWSRAFCSAPFSCPSLGSCACESELGGAYMKATAELKMLPVSVLKPAAYNPRKKLKPGDKEYEKIKNSITEFGFADPLVVNADMTIIGGHQRLTVAMELGYTEVPCAVVDIDKTRNVPAIRHFL